MKWARWAKAVEPMALVVGYFWYNADFHLILRRVIS
jgi:hypothetical protein